MESDNVAVMQPYLFPYLGYFHLIAAAREFVFYDDVSFINRGWINRNNILVDGNAVLFSVPLAHASQNRLIKDIAFADLDRWHVKFLKTLSQAYHRAPQRTEVLDLVGRVFSGKHGSIADLAVASIEQTLAYLGVPFRHHRSSQRFPHTSGLGRAERLVQITKELGFSAYVNAPGGKALYDKSQFAAQGIRLSFLKSAPIVYAQSGSDFVPNLSIIDVLMYNDKSTVRGFLRQFALE